MVRASRRFAVNLLAGDQVELSNRLAGKHDSPFDGVDHKLSEYGIPVLSVVLSALECETLEELDVGTHTVFIGRVVHGARLEAAPLVYHDGSYAPVMSEGGRQRSCAGR